ncbi:MAG: hypothetical protein CL927_15455 [Deltaproteobacteria bacterium]|nr:hypothetical protein [Deltaproteobacteria bacterium]
MPFSEPQATSPPPQNVRAALDALLADRHGSAARNLFLHLAQYSDRRVQKVARNRYGNLLTDAHREELVGEVLFELMNGSLAAFRGQTIGELTAFVRCICDRLVWRLAQKQIRERDTLSETGFAAEMVRAWNGSIPGPADQFRFPAKNPLQEQDSKYLLKLLDAGSRADLARLEGVSRAAVTQRIQRIKRRIAELSDSEQAAAEAWFAQEAERSAGRRRPAV